MSDTVGTAIEMLNNTLHDHGAHVEFVLMKDMPESDVGSKAPQHLMNQTFDWRYVNAGRIKADKEEYTVKLSADDMKYIGRAMEVYWKFLYGCYLEPALKRCIERLGEVQEERGDAE